MRVAIHQPNFIPWKPFFDKMASADIFVILTYAQFNREHFQHRFKYQDRWYTMSVEDVRHADAIRNRRYANPLNDWAKIKRRLPQFAKWFSQFDDCICPNLLDTNFKIILRMAELLGQSSSKIIYDPIPSCTGTDRLVEICRALNGKVYVAGRSGAKYMEPEKFTDAGIVVEYQTVSDTRHIFEL